MSFSDKLHTLLSTKSPPPLPLCYPSRLPTMVATVSEAPPHSIYPQLRLGCSYHRRTSAATTLWQGICVTWILSGVGRRAGST